MTETVECTSDISPEDELWTRVFNASLEFARILHERFGGDYSVKIDKLVPRGNSYLAITHTASHDPSVTPSLLVQDDAGFYINPHGSLLDQEYVDFLEERVEGLEITRE